MPHNPIHKGDILLALPCIPGNDIAFSRSVVLITEHDNQSTIGYILNKPTSLLLNDLTSETEGSFTIYEGGPVEQDSLYCLHQRPDIISDSLYVKDNLYSGGNFEEIFHLINTGKLSNKDIRFYLGYSGWDPAQLQDEIENKYWKTMHNIDYNQMFNTPTKTFWKSHILKLGNSFKVIANAPLDPTFN